MIRTNYHPETDAFTVRFAEPGAAVESEEVAPGVTLDFDAAGQVVGIEILGVRARAAVGVNPEPPLLTTSRRQYSTP